MDKAVKFGPGKYGYKTWIIEKFDDEGIWLMFPPGQGGATDAANTLKDAKAMIDQWEFRGWIPAVVTHIKIADNDFVAV